MPVGQKISRVWIVAGLLLACSPPANLQEKASSEDLTANSGRLENASIVLTRGGGEVQNPLYGISVYLSGEVEFCGVMNVNQIGERRAEISPERVRVLMDRAIAAGFFDLEAEYIAPILHVGGVELTLAHAGKRKSVFEIGGARVSMPAIVTHLTNEIDDIANSNGWIGDPSTDPQGAFPPCAKKYGFMPPEPMPPPVFSAN